MNPTKLDVNVSTHNPTGASGASDNDHRTSTSELNTANSVDVVSSTSDSTSISTMGVRRYSSKRVHISVAILCFINLINYMDRYTLAGVLTRVKSYYGLNDSQAGLLQTSFIASYMIMAPIFGYLGDRFDRRYVMAFGILFWSITTFLGSIVPPHYFPLFAFLRALVGTGEASYSTIAPTVIADMFTNSARTKMLSLFYFAIPVGSGLGYIIGPQVADRIGRWYWALRVTPPLGIFSVVLCLTVLVEPPRGEADGGVSLKSTSVIEDILAVIKIPSFLWVSLGFTCVTFSVGALAWWVPDFMTNALLVSGEIPDKSLVSLVFGVITCFAGIFGVVLGSLLSQYYRRKEPRADPLICAYSIIVAVPLNYIALMIASSHVTVSYVLIFFCVMLLCMNWVLVADIVLYVVIPKRRAMAQAIQITLSHALGDAVSPYIVGAVSDAISGSHKSAYAKYTSQEYALFLPMFILVLGALCFFINSFYVVEDKDRCSKVTRGETMDAVLLPSAPIPEEYA